MEKNSNEDSEGEDFSELTTSSGITQASCTDDPSSETETADSYQQSESTLSSPPDVESIHLDTVPPAGGLTSVLGGLRSWLSWSTSETPLELVSPVESEMSLSSNLLGTSSWSSGASYARRSIERDPVIIEKSNLVNILKLVIKEVIESSLKFGRQLDSDHIPLQHFFIVLEHVLRHGLRPKKGLLGPKKELWDLLQLVEKKDSDALDITASVRELPTVKTPIGRARAWLRLALMQKKMADYFRTLVDQSDDLLAEFYEPRALLRSEEAILITGLLVSLNVVDCNLCVKEEDLDSQQGVIDFSLYLRSNKDSSYEGLPESTDGNMTAVLDQKHYIEELNRHLNATVANMQAKIEGLTTTNALMKEDLAIARGALYRSQEENKRLMAQLDRTLLSQRNDSLDYTSPTYDTLSKSSKDSSSDGHDENMKQKLLEETRRREELEKELKLQRSMKAEMEMAMKLLEKNVHEKQDTIISLRDQLEDIKRINLEMYSKLQECQKSLKQKSELISRLEEKSKALADTLQKLDEKYVDCESDKRKFQSENSTLRTGLTSLESKQVEIDNELKIEREWRQQLQEASMKDREELSRNKEEIAFLQKVASDYNKLRKEHAFLRNQVSENEKTMEELGLQLSHSKLQVDSLMEEHSRAGSVNLGTWKDDSEVTNCQLCEKEFNLSRRKHHCRHCGGIFCDRCSDAKLPLASSSKPVRVCDGCHAKLAN